MVFATKQGLSQKKEFPLLIYRSTESNSVENEQISFRMRTSVLDAVYFESIHVSVDLNEFLPYLEEFLHKCVKLSFTFN
jgi:hypothetical protein